MSVYPRTAGFTHLNLAEVRDATLLLVAGLMFIGGASGSTAGGIKVTTFSTLFFAIVSALRGEEQVRAFERSIPARQVYRALSVALLSVAVVFLLTFGLLVTARFAFIDVLFEAVSAFGTVGLSTGVTPTLPDTSRAILILGMFIGRLGPLTLALALTGRAIALRYRYPEDSVTIG
jgi:trk system potassium uptake protein TrkH